MPTTFALPTQQEVNEAVEVMIAEGPVPLAQLVDQIKPLGETLEGIIDHVGMLSSRKVMLLAKSCFVLGLRLGLTIEARRKKNPRPSEVKRG